MNEQQFPAGWSEERVRQVLEHYDSQTDEERAAEIDAAFVAEGVTVFAAPNELADQVRRLIAERKTA